MKTDFTVKDWADIVSALVKGLHQLTDIVEKLEERVTELEIRRAQEEG